MKAILLSFATIFCSNILFSQINKYNFTSSESPHMDSIFVYKGDFTWEIIPAKKEIILTTVWDKNIKWDFSTPISTEPEKMTYRKSKDTIINNENYKLYFINGDPDMIYQADLEYKVAVSPNKLLYFNEYSFSAYGLSKNDLPQSYMLKENKELAKLGRKPSSYRYNKDFPKIRTKEEVMRDENSRTPLEKAWECNKIYPAHLGIAIENLGIFLMEHNDPKEKQNHDSWIKREFDLLKSTGKLVVNCSYISGTNFQIANNNGCNAITWTDSMTKSPFYSNKAFKELDYAGDPQYGGSSIYNFQGGARTPDYNLNWQLIKSNDDQSYRVFRNCYLSYILEIKKGTDNSGLSLTLTQVSEMMRTQTGYFSDCKNVNEKTIYRANHWADIKTKGDWAKAMDEPVMEKVEIIKTNEAIKVTFGAKVYNYLIVSENKFSEVKMDYLVTLNGKKYTISIMDFNKSALPNLKNKGTYSVNIEGTWMVSDIKDVSIEYGE